MCPKQFVVTNLTFLHKSTHIQLYILYIHTFTNVHMYKIYLQNPVYLLGLESTKLTSYTDSIHKVHSQYKVDVNNLKHFLKLLQNHFCFLHLHMSKILMLQSCLKSQKGDSFCQARRPVPRDASGLVTVL